MKPKMIVLIGMPGSGKTHLASKAFPHCVRISQDELGSRGACLEATRKALNDLKSVVIDRCNMSIEQRSEFLALANKYTLDTVVGVHVDADTETCIDRVVWRKGHPTIPESMPYEQKKGIVLQFDVSFEPPTFEEGFTTIITTKNSETFYQDVTCL